MADRVVKEPSADHPISIEKNGTRVTVMLGGHVVADTVRALILREANYPAVAYVPREDVRMDWLVRSDHKSYCPYKGEASYFGIEADDAGSKDAIWTYEQPHTAVSQIASHLAFYPERVDAITGL